MRFGFSLRGMQSEFFTSSHVRGRLDATKYHYLRYMGMNIRRSAIKNVRTESPGTPSPGPTTRRGGGLALIYYHFDRSSESVVVGPIGFPSQPWREMTVPEVLEYGGRVTPQPGRRSLSPRRIPALPYMRPAMEAQMTQKRQRQTWQSARRKARA